MRILVGNWSCRMAGGTETHLAAVMPLLAASGHPLAFCFEVDEPDGRHPIPLPEGTVRIPLRPDPARAIDAIRAWRPDVTYVHGFLNPAIESRVIQVAPAVLVAHSYYGTCISGDKTHKFPVAHPCRRRFGPACLALYFPRRCGGLSPVSMLTAYTRQHRRFELLKRYAAVIAPSAHMHHEFLRHQAASARIVTLPHAIADVPVSPEELAVRCNALGADRRNPAVRLTFVGRMDRLKGGGHLLDAVPRVCEALRDRPIRLTFVGEGPARQAWEQQAGAIVRKARQSRSGDVAVDFAGWLAPDALGDQLRSTDILVMPSIWPEPFGLTGLEANSRGIPVVAYATGGIPEWLQDGVNGCLAPGDPPTVEGLADALVRCVRSLDAGPALNRGAVAAAAAHRNRKYVDTLLQILQRAATGTPATA